MKAITQKHISHFSPFLVLAAMTTTASMVSAGINVWTTNGPFNPDRTIPFIRALAIDPSAPATLYAGASAGVIKSTNGGGSWAPINSGLTNTDVHALAIDPVNPATLYAGAYGGIFKSTDSGGTWVAVNTGLTSLYVEDLAIDSSTPKTLYAGTFGSGVFKSTDSGGTWAAVNTGLGSLYVFALAVDPADPATLYAGTEGPQVFKSTDSGGTWSVTGAGPNDPWGYGAASAFAINPAAPSTLYVGTDYGVFKSTDRGDSWTVANSGLTNTDVVALAIDPSRPATLYAGTWGGGVFKSADGGASWTSMNAGLTNLIVRAFAIDPSTPARIYAGTDGGVYEYLTAAGPFGFYTVPPCRVADTRDPPGPWGSPSLVAGSDRSFALAGQCGIPPDAAAVSLNLTVVEPTDGPGHLTIYPRGAPLPVVSTINYRAGQIRANNVIVSLDSAGDISVHCGQGSGTADMVIDVNGYFK
jgi:photosystem II stability/assembly factor-like uncharacterized protein